MTDLRTNAIDHSCHKASLTTNQATSLADDHHGHSTDRFNDKSIDRSAADPGAGLKMKSDERTSSGTENQSERKTTDTPKISQRQAQVCGRVII